MKDSRLKAQIKKWKELERQGYILTKDGKLEHRQVCWRVHGPFPSNWVVMHVDTDVTNNHPDNLIAMPRQLYNKAKAATKTYHVYFTRGQLASMVKSYLDCTSKKELNINITVQIGPDQKVDAYNKR